MSSSAIYNIQRCHVIATTVEVATMDIMTMKMMTVRNVNIITLFTKLVNLGVLVAVKIMFLETMKVLMGPRDLKCKS